MTDHEAEVVTARPLYAQHLPRERLAAVLLEPEGGDVADCLGDEVLVGQPGLQMQPYLESAMRVKPTASGRKPSSDPAAESAGRGAPNDGMHRDDRRVTRAPRGPPSPASALNKGRAAEVRNHTQVSPCRRHRSRDERKGDDCTRSDPSLVLP